jgi:hypothetical protein
MSGDDKIYADASQPATLRYGTKSIDCYTLGEAGLEWTRLSEQNRAYHQRVQDSGQKYQDITSKYLEKKHTAL